MFILSNRFTLFMYAWLMWLDSLYFSNHYLRCRQSYREHPTFDQMDHRPLFRYMQISSLLWRWWKHYCASEKPV